MKMENDLEFFLAVGRYYKTNTAKETADLLEKDKEYFQKLYSLYKLHKNQVSAQEIIDSYEKSKNLFDAQVRKIKNANRPVMILIFAVVFLIIMLFLCVGCSGNNTENSNIKTTELVHQQKLDSIFAHMIVPRIQFAVEDDYDGFTNQEFLCIMYDLFVQNIDKKLAEDNTSLGQLLDRNNTEVICNLFDEFLDNDTVYATIYPEFLSKWNRLNGTEYLKKGDYFGAEK